MSSKVGRIRTHGWKRQGCRLTPKIEKERVLGVREGVERLLKICYVSSTVLTANFHLVRKEGINYHFYLSFYSSEKTRFKEVQLPAQGDLDSKKRGLDTDSSLLSSTVPASPMATALGQERWWGRAGWGREEGNGIGCSWGGNHHHQGWMVPRGEESLVRGPGRSFSVLRCEASICLPLISMGFLTWMNLRNVMQSERNQAWKTIYHMTPFVRNVQERWIYCNRM